MKKFIRFFASIALFLAFTGFGEPKVTAISGDWIGEYTSLDHSVPIKVHFWQDSDGLKGEINLTSEGTKELPLKWVMFESTTVHFELVREEGTIVFDGQLKNGKISGDLIYSNLRGKFQLTPENLVSL